MCIINVLSSITMFLPGTTNFGQQITMCDLVIVRGKIAQAIVYQTFYEIKQLLC
jgi:hypothetical protein